MSLSADMRGAVAGGHLPGFHAWVEKWAERAEKMEEELTLANAICSAAGAGWPPPEAETRLIGMIRRLRDRGEKEEKALVEIGERATAQPLCPCRVHIKGRLRGIAKLVTDALTGSSKKEEVDPADAVCVCCGTRFGVKKGGETRRCEKCAEILHTLI